MLLGPTGRSWFSRQSLVIAGPEAGDIKRLALSLVSYRLLEAGLNTGAKFTFPTRVPVGSRGKSCNEL